jgi:hypothetical protein
MQKNEFEKQVQQKMEEFKLQPSNSVWSNIEAHISKKKRPKLVWLFIPITITLLGIGLWLINSKNTSTTQQKNELSKNATNESLDKQSVNDSTENNPAAVKTGGLKSRKKLNVTQIDEGTLVSLSEAKGENKVASEKHDENVNNQLLQKKTEDQIAPEREITLSAEPKENTDLISTHEQSSGSESKISSGENDVSMGVKNISSDSSTQAKREPSITENKVDEKVSVVNNKKKNAWRWGLNFSLGALGVPNKFLGSLDKSFAVEDALYANTPGGSTNSSAPLFPSKIESSGAFAVGVLLEKNISKNKIIALGLNYKRFSTTNKVGTRDSVQQYRLSNPVNSYHNYYHFLELPVSLKIQLTSKKIPLSWDAGLSLSQLIASNALQFSSGYARYTHDNSLFNKSQVGFNTGLSASLFQGKVSSFLIGPQIYYGLTKIAQEGLYKNQHFTFIGLKSQLLFKK